MKDQYKAGLGLFVVIALSIGATENKHLQTKSSTKTNLEIPAGCSGDIYLSSQAQVDAFPSAYGCTEISGSLTISGNDITNLDSLHFVTKVNGDLFISSNPNLSDLTGLSSLTYVGIGGSGPYPGAHITYNPKLTNLDGLNNLTSIAGLLEISYNDTLTNLDGLSSLQSIGATFPSYITLLITNNPALISLSGLRSIASLNGSFTLSNNSSLPNLHGLESLTKIADVQGGNAWLTIMDNASLSNIDGLSSLTDITGKYVGVTISNNPSLLNLNGLSSLRQIAGTTAVLEISNNISLPNVNGLSSLKKIGSGSLSASLVINNNTALKNVDGLSSLTEIRGTNSYLTVTGNTQLAKCCGLYNALKDMTSSNCFCNPHITISGNGAGCTKEDILAGGPCPVVCSGTIVLSSQAQVDAFPSAHPCNEISGSLYVSGNDITNLDSLRFVTKITGLLEISYNATLTNLDGLSSLQSIGAPSPIYNSLIITNNPALTSLNGLRSIASFSGSVTISYNSSLPNLHGLESLTKIADVQSGAAWLKITDNASLSNIDALSALTDVTGKYVGISIANNPSLLNVNGLSSLRQIAGVTAVFEISNNTSLSNVDGLSSLKKIGSGVNASLIINNNTALTNVDGLSSLTQIRGTNASSLTVTGNTQLARCCGLYNALNDMTGSSCSCNPSITISGNGAGCTKDDILAGGPCCTSPGGCPPPEPTAQPTNLVFSAVTDTTMTVSFTAATETPSGYITLMQAFGTPYPDDAPVDGTIYHTGDVIGSSSIVINVGSETSLDVIYLSPGIDYYFDVFSYNISNGVYDYLTVNPLEGNQRTTSSGSQGARISSSYAVKSTVSSEVTNTKPFPNPFSENITIPFTTNKQNAFVQIAVYDLTGRKIADVINQNFTPGYHEAKWWGTDNFGNKISQGIYVYQIRTNESKDEARGLLVAK